jgi:hypothetical protein
MFGSIKPNVRLFKMENKPSNYEPWKTRLNEMKAALKGETSRTKHELALLAIERLQGFIDATGGDMQTQAAKEFVEIASWLAGKPPDEPTSAELRDEMQQNISTFNWPFNLAWDYMEARRTPPKRRGAKPSKSRLIAIAARDFRNAQPPLSWGQIAAQLCRCGEKRHSRTCQDKIKKSFKQLETFLQSLQK